MLLFPIQEMMDTQRCYDYLPGYCTRRLEMPTQSPLLTWPTTP